MESTIPGQAHCVLCKLNCGQLTLYLLGNSACFSLSVDFFFQNQIIQKILSGRPKTSNSLGQDQAKHSVRPDLGPNCLQRFTADDTCRQS